MSIEVNEEFLIHQAHSISKRPWASVLLLHVLSIPSVYGDYIDGYLKNTHSDIL